MLPRTNSPVPSLLRKKSGLRARGILRVRVFFVHFIPGAVWNTFSRSCERLHDDYVSCQFTTLKRSCFIAFFFFSLSLSPAWILERVVTGGPVLYPFECAYGSKIGLINFENYSLTCIKNN